ncbi:MAG: hypothetical protein HZB57_00215 [Gammaproteobacteria bacterium]|nr:hypothetical protein [Gammaproteobacteria bacterium]
MTHHYSQRLVNPFRGILSVVETEDADAVSNDGIHWALYIHGQHELAQLNDGTQRDVTLPDIKYGDWSRLGGFKHAPIRNVVDHRRLDAIGAHLLEAVKFAAEQLPFPLRDHYELWLLDIHAQPLALLSVAVHDHERDNPTGLHWRPGEAAKAAFTSSSPLLANAANACAGQHVEDLVNRAAGATPMAQWFQRDAKSAGTGLDGTRIDAKLNGRRLESNAFPQLLLATAWAAPQERALLEEFLDWQAPWLLQLQNLSDTQRAQLEQIAVRRANVVAQCHQLYPQVIDEDRITAARVEARLRGTMDAPVKPTQEADAVDVTLIPYYRE